MLWILSQFEVVAVLVRVRLFLGTQQGRACVGRVQALRRLRD